MTHLEMTGLQAERPVIDGGTARTASSPTPRTGAPGSLPSWREILTIMAVSLVIAAVLVYGLLNLAYEHFYGALQVRPGDIGLTVGAMLSRSAGFIVVLAIAGTLVTVAVRVLLAGPRRRLHAHIGRTRSFHSRDFAVLLGCAVTVALLAVYTAAAISSSAASYTAEATATVRSGEPVRPLQLYGLPLLAIQADSAVVLPTSKARTLPGIWDLHDRPVLYLGQTNGIAVLYDPGRGGHGRVVYVPMSLIVMHISDCAGSASPPGCRPDESSSLST
jgi:hypothetical protein